MKSLSNELLDRAVLAMAAGIEIYNKPGFPYRNESFTILAINSWELLLKTRWLHLHGHERRSLYVYEARTTKTGTKSKRKYIKRTRSNSPFTRELGYLAKQLVNEGILNPSACRNLETMLEFRDCATHFYNEDPAFHSRLYEIGAACVKNFTTAIYEWFDREVTEFNVHLMPLTFVGPPSDVEGALLNAEQNNFLAFLDSIDEPEVDPTSPYSVRVNVDVKFTRSKAKDAPAVRVTNDPSAVPVQLTEENIRERYPWDYRTLTAKCRQRYADFKENSQYHGIRKGLENDQRDSRRRLLDPDNPNGTSKVFFNPNILGEFDKHYAKKESAP